MITVRAGQKFWLRMSAALLALRTLFYSVTLLASPLTYGWQRVDNLNIFFREGGSEHPTTLVFLHGYPASSIQYDKLMTSLATSVHVIAMDYPSFGFSDAPGRANYAYTFDHIAETVRHFLNARNIHHFGIYMQDYGVPVGFRLMESTPDDIRFVVVQNGVIHLDGFPAAQSPDGELRSHWQHRNAAIDARRSAYAASLAYPQADNWTESNRVSPEIMLVMKDAVQRPGVAEARNDLWHDYGSNVARYPVWQALLKRLNPPLLVIWGTQDEYFTAPGALAFLREVPSAEVHLINSTHFASIDDPDIILPLLLQFQESHSLNDDTAGPTPVGPAKPIKR